MKITKYSIHNALVKQNVVHKQKVVEPVPIYYNNTNTRTILELRESKILLAADNCTLGSCASLTNMCTSSSHLYSSVVKQSYNGTPSLLFTSFSTALLWKWLREIFVVSWRINLFHDRWISNAVKALKVSIYFLCTYL